ncbi:hypothetical protein CO112_03245 [Candidatus Dojkabacteria bacterium CG_4_9_14_3_um_filter_150_Dojkabacteria_WS6_41_13]|uniref:YggT family protein n=1 Tax=Candidatus Dojkabacteria bacterium CG_4_10_14_0_2_um_filter_Dojkabacteria_WS6_41_15 TaxID=2014249 RepID=A0A2M7W0Z3_9BACT|nr:MAG: hypothetical protein COX64_04865 [Candidatus Dojkabacteria bacterium CG_4_10_14_0_2_um_filter_Dojkabacteria_WS6_41_15]PJB22633.1 MAG: hypothetical protein CO112_03245 [Candidatus Dojkabacteria bacterium CG_4_9_14_3_um_filter_150_Dojkabacteria_WS6_41_13]
MLFRFVAQLGYTFVIIIETLLSLRLVLKLINVQPIAKIVVWLYFITDKILSPFAGLVPDNFRIFGITIELTTLLIIALLTFISYALYEIIKAYS